MKFLLSNDDGYGAIGLSILKKVLFSYGEVYVSAPMGQRSGASASISIDKEMEFEIVNDHEIKIDGTPSDSMAMGFAYFKDAKFDICFSGINRGYNMAKNIVYSGTIGASIVASYQEVPVVALSNSFDLDEEDIERKARFIIDYIISNNIYKDFKFLNVNFPLQKDLPYKGIRVGKPYLIPKEKHFELNENGKYRTYYHEVEEDVPLDSDLYLVSHGYFSLTALKPSLEDEENNLKLREVIEKKM